jgi:hypothetical protein
LAFAFSNNSAQPISELHFQLAVTKVSAGRENLFDSQCTEPIMLNLFLGLRTAAEATNGS